MEKVPKDPGGTNYIYRRISSYTYELCATLEDPPTPTSSCSGGGNFKVVNP
jgi:hypothetical protein